MAMAFWPDHVFWKNFEELIAQVMLLVLSADEIIIVMRLIDCGIMGFAINLLMKYISEFVSTFGRKTYLLLVHMTFPPHPEEENERFYEQHRRHSDESNN